MEAHPDLVRCRAVRRGLFLLGASAVLTIDFFVDGINVLPDAVAGICVLCAAVSMLKCVRMRYEPVMGVATAFLLIGTVATVRQSAPSAILHGFVSGGVMDSDSYSPTRYAVLLENANRMLKDADARTDFYVACAILLLAQLCFILLLLVVRRMLSGVIDRYTGSPIGRESDPRLAGADEEIRGRLKRGVLIATVIGCVVAVFPVVYMFTLPRALGTGMEAFGPLNTVLDIVFGNEMSAELILKPYEIKDEATGRVIAGNSYAVQSVDEDGEIYECSVKPYRNSDKALLAMLVKRAA